MVVCKKIVGPYKLKPWKFFRDHGEREWPLYTRKTKTLLVSDHHHSTS